MRAGSYRVTYLLIDWTRAASFCALADCNVSNSWCVDKILYHLFYLISFFPYLLTHPVYVWMFVVIQPSWLPNPTKVITYIIMVSLQYQWYQKIDLLFKMDEINTKEHFLRLMLFWIWWSTIFLHRLTQKKVRLQQLSETIAAERRVTETTR